VSSFLDSLGRLFLDLVRAFACASATWLAIQHLSLAGKLLWGIPLLWMLVGVAEALEDRLGGLLR